jgi:hypothetical protein
MTNKRTNNGDGDHNGDGDRNCDGGCGWLAVDGF